MLTSSIVICILSIFLTAQVTVMRAQKIYQEYPPTGIKNNRTNQTTDKHTVEIAAVEDPYVEENVVVHGETGQDCSSIETAIETYKDIIVIVTIHFHVTSQCP